MLAASTDYYILDLNGTQIHVNTGDRTEKWHKWGSMQDIAPCRIINQGKASASVFIRFTNFCHWSECRKTPASGEPVRDAGVVTAHSLHAHSSDCHRKPTLLPWHLALIPSLMPFPANHKNSRF